MTNKNEIVARWMGFPYDNPDQFRIIDHNDEFLREVAGTVDDLKYDSSYDWLIEAWVKFRDLKFDDFDIEREHEIKCRWIANFIVKATITEAFDELVKGIIWHESLTKQS